MADGSLSRMVNLGTSNVPQVPFAFNPVKDNYPRCSGPCDTVGISLRTQLQGLRYESLLFTFDIVTVPGFGTIAKGTRRTALAEGFGDIGTNAGWGATITLTQQQTNLYPSGSLNNSLDGAFVGRSIGVGVQRGFIYDPATGSRTYTQATEQYSALAARALLEGLSTTIIQKDEGTALFLGLPYHWPGAQQVSEELFPTVDKALGANIILPLERDYVFMDDNKGSMNNVTFDADSLLSIASDPALPIPAGFSIPINFFVYGGIIAASTACETSKKERVKRTVQEELALMDGLKARGLTNEEIRLHLATT